jgi:hypothetical protein
MKKLLPFLFLFAGLFAIFGILFLVFRTDALPANVRLFDRRKATESAPEVPVD